MINTIGIALSGLTAAEKKVQVSANNIANLDTVGSLDDPAHAPYTPQTVQQVTQGGGTVGTVTTPKTPPFVPAYDPGSPFASADGLVGAPNIDLGEEAVNIIVAKTAYRADLAVIKTAKEMQDDLLHGFDEQA